MDFGDLFFERFRYFASLLLIVVAYLIVSGVWSAPPSLAYLAIFLFGAFALLMTLLWILFLLKTVFGQILIGINSISSGFSIITLLTVQSTFHPSIPTIGLILSILAAVTTMVLGTLHHLNTIEKNSLPKDDELLDDNLI
jgi:hypothetical protein